MIKKIIMSLSAMTVVVYGIFVGALYLKQDQIIFPGPFKQSVRVDMEKFIDVTIPTEDGESLFALYHPPLNNEPVIVFFHGNGDAAIYQKRRSEALMKAGFGLLLLEYRGYPGSTGKPFEKGLFIDGRAAFDFLRQKTNNPIGLYAHSLGTGVAVKLASQRDVYALVLEAPYDSVVSVAQSRFPFVPVQYLLKHKFRSDIYIQEVNAPLLILHGARDKRIPPHHARRLHKRAPHGAQFKLYDRAGHIDLWRYGALEDAIEFFKMKSNQHSTRQHITQ